MSQAAHGDESGFARAIPAVAAVLGVGPALAAVHWAVAVAPSYDDDGDEVGLQRKGTEVVIRDEEEGEGKARMERRWLYVLWQAATIASR